MGNKITKTEILRYKIRNHLNSLNYDLLSKVLRDDFATISVIRPNFCFKGALSNLRLIYNKETNTFDYQYCTSHGVWIIGIDNLNYNQLYKLDYNILVYPLDNLNAFIKLIVHIVSANFIMLFIAGMSYIRYDIKKLYILSDFYTMIAEIIIWTFLIFFIISLIFISIFAFFYFNGKIELKRLIIFFIRNDMKNLKIILSIFVVLKTCIIYFSYVIYSRMLNTKLSINVSRVLALFISAASILIMKLRS